MKTNSSLFSCNLLDEDNYFFETNFEEKLGTVKKIESTVSISTSHELINGDLVTLNIKPNLNVGIGTSSSVKIVRNVLIISKQHLDHGKKTK